MGRRRLLAGLGGGLLAGIAGCGSDTGETTTIQETSRTARTTPTGSIGPTTGSTIDQREEISSETATGPDTREVGEERCGFTGFVVGVPDHDVTLNPMNAEGRLRTVLTDRLYARGTAVDPVTFDYRPWLVVDWEVHRGNATPDPTDPAVTATTRDDHEFHDRTELTARDVAGSIEYYRDHGPTSETGAHGSVDEVRVESPTELEVYLTGPEPGWFTEVLGSPIVPAHVWDEVSAPAYSPLDDGDVVGSGAYRLSNTSAGGRRYYLRSASEEYPPAAADWFPEGAPNVLRWRFEVYESDRSLSVDATAGVVDTVHLGSGLEAETVRAARREGMAIRERTALEFVHVPFNLRRVPFDDVAFRQFLVKAIDTEGFVETVYDGIEAVPGDYVLPRGMEPFRPPDPERIAGETYRSVVGSDPVRMPDLAFPGSSEESTVSALRSFLVDHPRRNREYRFVDGRTETTDAPDGRELYVDGQHLTGPRGEGTGGR